MSSKPLPEIHALGIFAHGALTALHVLGVVFNWRRGNRVEAGMHVVAVACSAYAIHTHLQESKNDASHIS